jgi:hypothetical protein
MNTHRKNGEAAQRFAERRRLEDEAPRLSTEIPALDTLKMEIEERTAGSVVAAPTHIRHIIVGRAPALFMIPCGDPRCRDGGHDVTHTVMRALRSKETRFEGQDTCAGSLGSGQCGRELRFTAIATYRG